MDNTAYWKNLVSTALRVFQEQGNNDAIFVIKNGDLNIEFNAYDNLNGGIEYWDIVFQLQYRDYNSLGERRNSIEAELLNVLEELHIDGSNRIANLIIRPLIERQLDWQAILPITREDTIQLIQEEKKLLSSVATGKSYKDDGVEEEYLERHQRIISIASSVGFDYPVTCESLAEWWIEIKSVGNYSERRAHIAQRFSPLIKLINESDNVQSIDFSQIATRSGTIRKAIDDANVFIRDGKYDSALDRIHTAFHGYLKQLLAEHGEPSGSEDGLPALYSKLHAYYADQIQPADVGDRIKGILRSAGGMVNAVNELRNNNTIAHPNGQLIECREACLVIKLISAVVDYIEDVEKEY